MKQTLFILTVVLVLGAPQIVLGTEEVKVVTYYPTPDTEYVELDVKDSPVFAESLGSNVVIGKNRNDADGNRNYKMDVNGNMEVKNSVLATSGDTKLAKLKADATPDREGEVWVKT